MKLAKTIYTYAIATIFMAVLLLASSCRDEYLFDGIDGPDDDTIIFGATLSANTQTRNSYYDEGVITDGTYYLYYPRKTSSSNVNRALVDFGNEEGPTTGFAYFYNAAGERKDLKWRHVYNEGATSQTFHMHNIDTTLYTIYHDNHWEHLRFNVKNVTNPFCMSPLDTINGTNDLIYGKASGTRTSGKLDFKLDHIMSLLKINVEVYNAKDGFSMNLDNAMVIITDVSTELGVFDLRDTKLFEYNTSTSTTANTGGYQHTPGYYRNIQDVTLVDPDNSNISWSTVHPGEVGEDYADHFNKTVYETMRWVLPPQSMPTTSSRDIAKVIVMVPYEDATGGPGPEEYKIFTGRIPGVMFSMDDKGNRNPTPEILSFKGGHQITITARINSPETELTFAPAIIEAWVSKGSFTVTTKQAGIYNSTDFYNATRLYSQGNYDMLERFGSVDGGLCSLQIWGNISVDIDRIKETMLFSDDDTEGKFEFCFNGYTVTLMKDGEPVEVLDGAVGQERLFNVVSGRNDQNYRAITTPDDFLTLIDYCNTDPISKDDLKRHGYFNNMDNTFTFDIRNDLTLEIDDIFQKLPMKILGYNIVFGETDGSVVTVNLTSDAKVEARSTDIIDKLGQIVRKTPTPNGFYDNESFLFMVECYNNYAHTYPELLQLYGTQNATTGEWTFYHKSTSFNGNYQMTVMGDYAYASMVPGGENDNPKYKYSYSGSNADITFESDWVTVTGGNRSISTWYNLTSGQSKTSNLATTGTYYNSKSSLTLFNNHGYFKDAMWHFPLADGYDTETFGAIFGIMKPDYENKKWDYEITWNGVFTVTDVPIEENSEETEVLELNFPADREMLESITNGTYWKKYKSVKPKGVRR